MDIPGGPGGPAQIDSRREPRVAVSWRALFRLPDGKTMEVRVRDISESGLGLLSENAIPQNVALDLALAVPDLIDASRTITVIGKLRAVYVVINRHDYRIGAVWAELDNASREMIRQHIKRGRYGG
ncbi:MAG: PilZ domain-containing protein [Burkholderiales bacterium]